MKLFIVSSKIKAGWDETNAVLVRARGPQTARKIVEDRIYRGEKHRFSKENAKVERLTEAGYPGEILIDFRAG